MLKTPVIRFMVIESGFRVFVLPENRSVIDRRSWEICFDAHQPGGQRKSYCWLVCPGSQDKESAVRAFLKRMKADPVDAAVVDVFDVIGPPYENC